MLYYFVCSSEQLQRSIHSLASCWICYFKRMVFLIFSNSPKAHGISLLYSSRRYCHFFICQSWQYAAIWETEYNIILLLSAYPQIFCNDFLTLHCFPSTYVVAFALLRQLHSIDNVTWSTKSFLYFTCHSWWVMHLHLPTPVQEGK